MRYSSWIKSALESVSIKNPRPRRRKRGSSHLNFSELETRTLLATLSGGDTPFLTFQSDPGQEDVVFLNLSQSLLQIRVGNGDSIGFGTFPGVAPGVAAPLPAPNPALQLTSFESTNDTLTINLANFSVSSLFIDLGDQNDSLTVSGVDPGGLQISAAGSLGDDQLDASAFTGGFVLFSGNDGDDVLTGSDGADILLGGAGNDLITGRAGDDSLTGGEGNDILRGNGGSDTLRGEAGVDTLNGGSGADELFGGDGNDFITGLGDADDADGGAGFDTLSFQATQGLVNVVIREDGSGANNPTGSDPAGAPFGLNDTFSNIEQVVGSEGDDIIRVDGARATTVHGLGGNDQLIGGTGNDVLLGGDGDDTLNGNNGDDRLVGGNGDDILLGAGGTDMLLGGNGSDTVSFEGIQFGVTATIAGNGNGSARYSDIFETYTGVENLTGTNFADVLRASAPGGSVIRGLSGDDILTGGEGDDMLVGNAGDDILRGNGGDDFAIGGNGNDNLNGGDGNDRLSGNRGDDFFVGIEGRDLINGGEGFDINSFAGIDTGVVANINADGSGTAVHRNNINEVFFGIESLHGSSNDDILTVTGSVGFELLGFDGDDQISGGSGVDRLVGGNGNDTLEGNDGNDLLFGQLGDDTLVGGLGDDFLAGGPGEDFLEEDILVFVSEVNPTVTISVDPEDLQIV